MLRGGKTPEEYIALLEQLEQSFERDRALSDEVYSLTDQALSANDADAFVRLLDWFSIPAHYDFMSRSPEMLKLRYLITAVENETKMGFPLFIEGIPDCASLLDRYDLITLLLRRLEFDLQPDETEALTCIREQRISAYALSAILYNMISHLGHREKVLMKIASDALDHGLLMEAYSILSVIEQPSAEASALRQELEAALKGGGA